MSNDIPEGFTLEKSPSPVSSDIPDGFRLEHGDDSGIPDGFTLESTPPKEPSSGLKSIARGVVDTVSDMANRATIGGGYAVGKLLDPFHETEENLRTFVQFLGGDPNSIPLTTGEKLQQMASEAPTNPEFNPKPGDPTLADKNASGVGFSVGEARTAASLAGYGAGAIVGATAAPVTLGASSIAGGVFGSIAASKIFDNFLDEGAQYGIPGFQQIKNDLAAKGGLDIPGMGHVTGEQLGGLMALPQGVTTVRNLITQYGRDVATRGAAGLGTSMSPAAADEVLQGARSYAASKIAAQGLAAMGGAEVASDLTQEIQNGKIDPQRSAIDRLTGLALMQPEGKSLIGAKPLFGNSERVEDHIDPNSIRPESTQNVYEESPVNQVHADLQQHQEALPPGAVSPEFEVLPKDEASPEPEKYSEPSTLDVKAEEVPVANEFIDHKGVSFNPVLVQPTTNPQDQATQLVAAHLSDGIRANGIQGQRIDVVNNPDQPIVFTSEAHPSTMFINEAHTSDMAPIDDYTRQIVFDRIANEESKHQQTIQSIQETHPGEDVTSVLANTYFPELTPLQVDTAVNGYGGDLASIYHATKGGPLSDQTKAQIVMETARMIAQRRDGEPTSEQMVPEQNFSIENLQPLIDGPVIGQPMLSRLLDRMQELDKVSRTGQIPFRDRHPNLIARISAPQDRGITVPAKNEAETDNSGGSGNDTGKKADAVFLPKPIGIAPASYLGEQFIPGRPSFHLYNLTEDIPGHPKGSTVSDRTLTNLGYDLPERPLVTGINESIISGASRDLLKKMKSLSNSTIDNYIQSNWTAEGQLPREVFDAWHDTVEQKDAVMQQASFLLRDVKKAIKQVNGRRIFRGVQMANQMEAIQQVLQGRAQFNPDSPLYQPVKRLRDFIDGLSDELIRSGATDSSLIPHIESQKGFYLTRSYQAFDDPKWYKKWEKEVGVNTANRAKSIVASWVMDDHISSSGQMQAAKQAFMADKQARWDALDNASDRMAFFQKQGRPGTFTIEDEQAVREALLEKAEQWLATPEGQNRLQGEINSLVRRTPNGQMELFSKGKLGSKNLNILKQRKDIPGVVREMMGEYKQADVNFTRSAAKMTTLWQNHLFLNKVRELGMNKFLFDKKTGDYFEPIAANGSETMAPLNGLYTTPEIAEAFRTFNIPQNLSWWAKQLHLANILSKVGVTTLNPASIGHNAISQTSSWILGGHWMAFNPANWRLPIATLAEREGWEGIRGLLGVKQDEARNYLDHMLRIGVLEHNAITGDLAQSLADTINKGETLEGLQGFGGTIRRAFYKSSITHEIPNSITKILQFESFRSKYAKALPAAKPRELDTMAAKAVQATTPTYSQVPKIVRYARAIPFTGPFISFSSEVWRNYFNVYKLAGEQWKNPATRGMAIATTIGILLYTGLFKALSKASATANNIDSNDETKFRKFLPSWSQNSQIVWLGSDGHGKLRYWDTSYVTHSSLMDKPIQALLDGQNPTDSLKQSLAEIGKPFLDPQMGVEAILEAYMNSKQRSSGGQEPVSNAPQWSSTQYAERTEHALAPLVPGALTSVGRMYEASQGNVKKYGQVRTMQDELVRNLGFNVTTLDLRQALKFNGQMYAQNVMDAEERYRQILTREGKVSSTELMNSKSAMEQVRKSEFDKMSDLVSTAKNLGLSPSDVSMSLSDAFYGKSLSKADKAVNGGSYSSYVPGKNTIGHAFENAEEQGVGQGATRVSGP